MAVYYTNWISGNDTTGDGTWANPYKSIWKATSTVSANFDEVRVVGSEWTDLPGTLSFVERGTTITTSQDLTSFFPELTSVAGNNKVLITIDNEFGFYKNIYTVVAVTSTTLTLVDGVCAVSGNYGVKRINTQHYTWSALPTSPAGSAGYVDQINGTNLNLYTDIKVTGGWTADGVQGGQTAIVMQRGAGNTSNDRWLGVSGSITGNKNMYMSGFILANVVETFSPSSVNMAIGNWWFYRVTTASFSNTNSNYYNNKAGDDVNIYVMQSRINNAWNVGSSATLNETCTINIWHQIPNGIVSNTQHGPNTSRFIFKNIHLLTTTGGNNTLAGYSGAAYFNTTSGSFDQTLKINNFNLYGYKDLWVQGDGAQKIAICRYNGSIRQVEIDKVNYSASIPWGSLNLTTLLTRTQSVIGDGTQSLDDLRIWGFGTIVPVTLDVNQSAISWLLNTSDGPYRSFGAGESSTTQYMPIIMKVNDTDYVTGTNSLQIVNTKQYSAITSNYQTILPIAAIPTFTTTKTLTIKAKTVNLDTGTWPTFALYNTTDNTFYGQGTPVWTSPTVSITNTWQDLVFTIDLSAVSWLNGVIPSKLTLIVTNNYGPIYGPNDLLIDSIELS